MLNLSKIGWSIIITVSIFMIVPIYGFIDDPIMAWKSYSDLLIYLVVIPHIFGAAFIIIGMRSRK